MSSWKVTKQLSITILLLFGLHKSEVALAQSEQNVKGSQSEIRLGYTAEATVYPSSINEQAITVYKDPSDNRQRRYIKPIFMPSWEGYREEVEAKCSEADPAEIKAVGIKVQFASKKLNEEVAALLAVDSPGASLGKLFSYPVYALFVVSGARDPTDDIQSKIQFRYPYGISEALPRGTIAAIDHPLTGVGTNPPIRVSESCRNLRQIYETRDLNAFIYTEHAEVKLNAISAITEAFVQSRAFLDLERNETASGVVRVSSSSGNAGIGFNLGGMLGGSGSSGTSTSTQDDNRRRMVSASVIQNAVEEGLFSGVIYGRFETPEMLDSQAIINSLMQFVLGEVQSVKVRIEKLENGRFAIVADTHKRTLSEGDVKILLDSAPTAELNMSGKEQIDCAMMVKAGAPHPAPTSKGAQPSQCGAERALTSKFNDSIKWQRDGASWIPTEVDLYAIDTQSLRQRAIVGIETAAVIASSDAQIHTLVHVTDAEPTDYLVDQMDKRIRAVVLKIDGPKKVVASFGGGLYKTVSYWGGGAANQVSNCQAPLQAPGEGFTQVGGEDMDVVDGRNIPAGSPSRHHLALGCKPTGHCDSTGEFCISYFRTNGCFVNTDWLAWYQQKVQSQGAQVKTEEICAQPL